MLDKQPNTPRTRAVKNLVLNANKGYQNPLNNYIGRNADQFFKQKETED